MTRLHLARGRAPARLLRRPQATHAPVLPSVATHAASAPTDARVQVCVPKTEPTPRAAPKRIEVTGGTGQQHMIGGPTHTGAAHASTGMQGATGMAS